MHGREDGLEPSRTRTRDRAGSRALARSGRQVCGRPGAHGSGRSSGNVDEVKESEAAIAPDVVVLAVAFFGSPGEIGR